MKYVIALVLALGFLSQEVSACDRGKKVLRMAIAPAVVTARVATKPLRMIPRRSVTFERSTFKSTVVVPRMILQSSPETCRSCQLNKK